MLYRAVDLEKVGGVTIDRMKLGSKVAQGMVQIGLSLWQDGSLVDSVS